MAVRFIPLEIGKAIRLKGFTTYVPDQTRCASACALAWLGGRARLMSRSASVGFHAAYTEQRGVKSVASAGNALVGAYLAYLGLPESAIIFVTSTPPDGVQWLNFADAEHYGIEVKPYDLPTPAVGTSRRGREVGSDVSRDRSLGLKSSFFVTYPLSPSRGIRLHRTSGEITLRPSHILGRFYPKRTC